MLVELVLVDLQMDTIGGWVCGGGRDGCMTMGGTEQRFVQFEGLQGNVDL